MARTGSLGAVSVTEPVAGGAKIIAMTDEAARLLELAMMLFPKKRTPGAPLAALP